MYVRTDSDNTTVISPRVRGSASLSERTRADATYAADIWSSASVDIRASASVRPVTEQRDELDLQLSHELEDLQLHGGYRFSIEHDYTSHGGSLGGRLELANNAATLEADLHVIADTVGQSGHPEFARSLTTIDGSLSFTQVLDPAMFAQLTYELAYNSGYQASPYRYVGAGGTGFGCVDAGPCLPEHVPETRMRHAIALVLRRALSEAASLGVSYRFYLDDWALRSHTVLAELGWNVGAETLLSFRYRFYTQGAVEFYRAVYETLAADTLRTRDRELSALIYQRAGAELEHAFDVGARDTTLALTLAVSGNLYSYADFVGLREVFALEVSAGLMVRM
ncbi:MAG TPA: DUF3570 domain-containing protein [Polyangiales bacterium]|nr:DUF3570 domain-containing protein [Polyangiales bacterium]